MQPDTIGSFENFLNYGPVGLAGLMLVLVIFAMTLQKPSAVHASLLKFFMVIGAVCFLAALAAESFTQTSTHQMSVVVAPNDFGSESTFPKPIIKLNGNRLNSANFKVSKSGTLIIDVTESVGVFSNVEKEVQLKSKALVEASQTNRSLLNNVKELTVEVKSKEVELIKEKELSNSLIFDLSSINNSALNITPQLSPRTIQAIQNQNLELRRNN